jgi:ATP-dependent protease ClpP protease subunit
VEVVAVASDKDSTILTKGKSMTKAMASLDEDEKKDGLNFVKNGNIFIYGTFDSSIAKDIIPEMLLQVDAQKKLKDGKIKIYVDSPGGYTNYLYNMLAIIEDAKKNGVIIETYVFGNAYSCASVLAASGSKGYRFISYLSNHLCHLGSASTGIVINDIELERSAEKIKYHFDMIRNLYRKYANLENLDDAMKFDNYFIRGEMIIKNGLADKFID